MKSKFRTLVVIIPGICFLVNLQACSKPIKRIAENKALDSNFQGFSIYQSIRNGENMRLTSIASAIGESDAKIENSSGDVLHIWWLEQNQLVVNFRGNLALSASWLSSYDY